MNWADEPAAAHQLKFLSQLGCMPDHPITRGEALQLIRNLQGGHASGESLSAPKEVGEACKQEAFRLRKEAESARCALAEAAPYEIKEKEEEAAHAHAIRQEFWLDTCREVQQMHLASGQVLELYRSHGCRFTVPGTEAVQEVLDALDAALPTWDRDHPELFYQTLELNFPELLRA